MKISFFHKVFLISITTMALEVPANTKINTNPCAGKVIILKFDDIRASSNDTYNSSWQRVADSIRSYGIVAAMGPVMSDLTKGSQAFKDTLTSWHNSPHFEIWNHGWTHTRLDYPPNYDNVGEFSGTPYQYQRDHFEWGNQIAKDELGITLRTFGAPYNQTDPTFTRVIQESPDTKVWLYCGDSNYDGMCLLRGSNNKLEASTGVVSYESFLLAYESNTYPYLVLQGHPGQWSTGSFEEFDKVIKFIKEQGDCFTLPYDYYLQEVNDPMVYEQDFDDSDSLYIYSSLDKVDASQTCCGELKLTMKNGATLDSSSPLIHRIGVNGATTTLDIGLTRNLFVRLRSTDAMNLRVDLSDGTNATDGANGKVTQSIVSTTTEWVTYEFVFPEESILETGLNTQQISEIHLYPNPETDNFPGTLYIDYISIGDESDELATCKSDIDRDGCTLMFEEQFDDQKLNNIESDYLDVLDTLESGCGELVLNMKSDETFPASAPIIYEFPTSIDFTQNPLLAVRLRSSHRFDMRIDLSDGSNETNGPNGQLTSLVPANTFVWNQLEYHFPQSAFTEKNVDSTAITEIKLYLDPTSDNFPGTIYIDAISAGKPSGIGNAIGKSEIDSCGIVPVIEEPQLGTVSSKPELSLYPNPTNSKFTFRSNSNESGIHIKVMDVLGKELIHRQISRGSLESEFDISNLKSGLYIISITTDLYTHIERINKR